MGDENSLAGATKAHKHGSLASDGGFLQTTDTGVTNMSEGSIGYYNSSSVLQELTSGSSGNVLTMGATLPAWSAGASSTWTELINIYDAAEIDTSFVDMKTYRWLDIWVSGYLSTGSSTDGFLMQWYDPDESLAGGTHYTSAGYFGNTYYTTGSGADIPLTFDQTVTADRPFFLHMGVTCSPVDKAGGGASMFSWTGSHRIAPDASFWNGAGLCINGWSDTTALQFCNGFKFVEGNTYQDCIISVYGAGDNTS